MTTERKPDDTISKWLEAEAPIRMPDRVLGATFERTRVTRQQGRWRALQGRLARPVLALGGAAVVVVAAAAALNFLPQQPDIGGQPTIAPSPSPLLLARGNWVEQGRAFNLEATREGSSVTGRTTMSADDGGFTVDLQCTRTTEDGVIMIGGDTTDSTTLVTYEGTRAAIILKRGSPVQATFWFQRDDARAASCLAFLDDRLTLLGGTDGIGFMPIEGTIEFGP